MITFHIITVFPQFFPEPLSTGLFGKAQQKGIINIALYDLRDYTTDPHRVVDDVPYGGGAGMVMKPEPLARAVDEVKKRAPDVFVINLSPRGLPFTQKVAETLAEKKNICFLCSRYEGVDERIVEHLCDAEYSIGDYVLHAGETAALVIIDAV